MAAGSRRYRGRLVFADTLRLLRRDLGAFERLGGEDRAAARRVEAHLRTAIGAVEAAQRIAGREVIGDQYGDD